MAQPELESETLISGTGVSQESSGSQAGEAGLPVSPAPELSLPPAPDSLQSDAAAANPAAARDSEPARNATHNHPRVPLAPELPCL